ncbi:glycosyltransferase [Leptolyngbya cf. ectocarpi LEGE 11479]|uniref:Glycosyltransferase n=1 Tax=Leptolyngbya cf. ectocarpi LEGE 11479 TaxID=1828722 RepID=A0A928X3U8_LEPEC|nr:glycosyltransferase [Leptolyngbya ectocarpi]MBE9066588.1 glycosyltransferase [Leptolyngbya cf. ectocarpi LEGE 11479]
MRKLYFLLPGTTKSFYCGGLFAELNTLKLAQQVCEAEVVTYRQREENHPFIDDVLQQGDLNRYIFVVSWGFDVPKYLHRLSHAHVVYHAHSSGYGFSVPPQVPIVSVSRNTMGYWGARSQNSLLYWLPNQLPKDVSNRQLHRDIDILVQARKTSEYVSQQLIPELQKRFNVVVVDSFVDDLMALFNRAKIYLYDSAEYWVQYRLTEGFGLPPMEALACGCQVFSSVNHALADYLDPGENCYKIAGYATGYDVQRITAVLDDWQPSNLPDSFFAPYRTEQLVPRLETILTELNQFFDYRQKYPSDIASLTRWRELYLFYRRIQTKLRKGLK